MQEEREEAEKELKLRTVQRAPDPARAPRPPARGAAPVAPQHSSLGVAPGAS